MQSDAANNQYANEFDAFQIARALWRQVWVIISVTAIAVVLGLMYAFFSERVFEARAYLVPPTQSDIAELNAGRTKEFELEPYTIEQVYRLFVRNLLSETLRQEFFESTYLPSLSEDEKKRSQDALYAEFLKKLKVTPVTADEVGRYSVIAQTGNAEQSVDWVKKYIKHAELQAVNEITKNVSYEAKVRAQNMGREIDAKRETGEAMRADTLVKLRASLGVAEAVGVQKPTMIFDGTPNAATTNMTGEMSFLRGVEALKAEIKSIEGRSSNDAFLSGLRDLQAKKSFFEKLAVTPLKIDMYRYDGDVEVPQEAIKPKRTLVVLLALVLGLMLGVLAALSVHHLGGKSAKKSPGYQV
ncbi:MULTISPECIES: Wzz/FepE/Etk N-terminal domain-containing protein [Pseudomonas fluorescens group]